MRAMGLPLATAFLVTFALFFVAWAALGTLGEPFFTDLAISLDCSFMKNFRTIDHLVRVGTVKICSRYRLRTFCTRPL
jgi:hypothetical protein